MSLMADMWTPPLEELKLFAPELALVATIAAVLLVPLVTGRSARTSAGVSLIGIAGVLLFTVISAPEVVYRGRAGLSPADAPPMLICDNLALFFKLFLMLFLVLIIGLWLTGKNVRSDLPAASRDMAPGGPEFFVLLLVSALGMILMVGSLNLLMILIAVEMASLPSYAIVASNKRSRRGAEASIKYVLFGGASAAIMAYGVSLLYGSFGTLDVNTMMVRLSEDPSRMTMIAWVGLLAAGAGVAFKIAAVPFHFWCPDVFEGAPVEVTTWLSVASKAAGLGLLLRLVYALGYLPDAMEVFAPLAWGIGLIAGLTCTIGNLAALRQESVKRLLAYSSIAHAGYMMMAAAILAVPGGDETPHVGVAALIAYLLVYLLMNLGAFGVTAMIAWQRGSDHLTAFNGLGRIAPWLALPMTLCLFSLVGLPPLGGFAAKWWLMVALGEGAQAQTWLWGLVMVLVLNTAISLWYYVRIIRAMYLTEAEDQPAFAPPVGGVVLVNLCGFVLLLLGTVLFNPLGRRADAFASDLFAPDSPRPAVTVADMDPTATVENNTSTAQTALASSEESVQP